MTKNQIQYWMNQYTKDHYERSDAETARANRAREALGYAELAEATRHNQRTESINAASVSLGYAQLAETQRMNSLNYELTKSSINSQNSLREAQAENQRSQSVLNSWKSEETMQTLPSKIDLYQADITLRNQQTANQKAQTYRNYAETADTMVGIANPLKGLFS